MEQSDFEVGLGLGFERAWRLPDRGHLLGGISTRATSRSPWTRATRRCPRPVRLGLFVPLVLGVGWLEPGVRVGMDWLFISIFGLAGL